MAARQYKTSEKQREQSNVYYAANRERVLAYYKELPEDVKERRRARARAWRARNKVRKALYDQKWREENRSRWLELQREMGSKPERRMVTNLRRRLRGFVRVKKGKSSAFFGCTPEFLRKHIEQQFKLGMTWENYGAWHIDHIKPCASFDLTKPEERRACFHWSNLSPLWAADNIAKGAKIFIVEGVNSPHYAQSPNDRDASTSSA